VYIIVISVKRALQDVDSCDWRSVHCYQKPILYKRISVEYCKHEGSD